MEEETIIFEDIEVGLEPVEEPGEERTFLVKSEEKQYVLGPVLIPNRFDAQNDAFTPEVIEETAHRFLRKLIAGVARMNVGHQRDRADIVPAESWVSKSDGMVADRRFPKGTWFLGAYLPKDLWTEVKAGRLNGWSIHGPGRRAEIE